MIEKVDSELKSFEENLQLEKEEHEKTNRSFVELLTTKDELQRKLSTSDTTAKESLKRADKSEEENKVISLKVTKLSTSLEQNGAELTALIESTKKSAVVEYKESSDFNKEVLE
ncbi:unnamed protein product [Ilex paraguariensis]|uniref:Uncharacterized protein n=1 Tax=Ilex paraguariensis TaxID=185542 RepID=A0ABC8RLZ6_9AQUA